VSLLRRSAYVFPEKIAVVHGDRRYSYRVFEERVNRLASGLLAAGIEPGDRVAFLGPNTPAMLEAHFAIPAIGAVLVPINTRLDAGEIRYILEHSGAQLLFADHELVHLVEDVAIGVIRIDDTGGDRDPYEAFLAAGSPELVEFRIDDEEQTISMRRTRGQACARTSDQLHHLRLARKGANDCDNN
jgi:fatty-acyl-CoA synthase